MDPSTSPQTTPISEQEKRDRCRAEGLAWARDVESDNAWDSLVLTLGTSSFLEDLGRKVSHSGVDGGGIRGYSSLLILSALMERIAFWEKDLHGRQVNADHLLPCHYFDYIWGTSTGGYVSS